MHPGGHPVAPDPGPGAAAEVIALLAARQQSIAVAESLTGGLLAAALTGIPGASAVFRGGVVAYATELKAVLLGVDRGLLEAHGAVSAEVASAMAEGVRGRLGAAVGAATTGVAGPTPPRESPPGPCTSRPAPGARPGCAGWPCPAAGPPSAPEQSAKRWRWSLSSCGKRPDDYSVTLEANTAAGAFPTVGEGEYGGAIERHTSRRECRDGPASSLAW